MRRYIWLVVVGLTLFSRPVEAGRKYEFIGVYEQDTRVILAVHGGVSKYSTWPIKWDDDQQHAAAHRGMKVFNHMRETGDDWMGVHIFVPPGDTLFMDSTTQISMWLPDFIGAELVSKEIVLTESPDQYKIFSSQRQNLIFTDAIPIYHRAQNGAYVAFIRFTKGSLDLDHNLSIERAGMPVPLTCRIISNEGR